MRLSETASKLLFGLVIPLVAGVLCMNAAEYAVATNPELNGIDATLQQRQIQGLAHLRPDPRIVIVAIQNDTAAKLPGLLPDTVRIPRTQHAKLLDGLDAAGATVALFDLEFQSSQPKEDQILRNSIDRLKHLQVTLSTLHVDDVTTIALTPAGVDGHLLPSAIMPFQVTDHVAFGGVDELVPADSDQFIGGYVEQLDSKAGVRLLHSAITAALQDAGEVHDSVHHSLADKTLSAGSHTWSLNENQALLVRWTAQAHPFPEVEYSRALNMLDDPAQRSFFKGKIVVIGDYREDAAGKGDSVNTAPFGFVPGSLFVAQLVNTALLPFGAGVNTVGDLATQVWVVLLAALAFHGALSRKWLATLVEFAMAAALAIAGPMFVVRAFQMTTPAVEPFIGVLLAGLIGLLLSTSALAREAHRPIGDEAMATVMFADLKGSTPLVHKIGASAYATLITDLLNRFTSIINAHGGEVERTLGDGILAVFRERGSRHHALRAMDSIAQLQSAVATLGAEQGLDLSLTIGIESGLVSGTYVHEAGRPVWTSTGATLNLAQRLQGLCGLLNISVAVGPSARAATEKEFHYRSAGTVTPKGFTEPVEVFCLEEPAKAGAPPEKRTGS